MSWNTERLGDLLHDVMADIHKKCAHYGAVSGDGPINYFKGANIAGFKKVADAMLAFGVL